MPMVRTLDSHVRTNTLTIVVRGHSQPNLDWFYVGQIIKANHFGLRLNLNWLRSQSF